MLKEKLIASVAFLSILAAAGNSQAALLTFTSQAAFQTALASLVDESTLDFDSVAAGTVIPSGTALEGVEFNYNLGGFELLVSDANDAVSGNNALGVDDGGTEVFLSGDSFTLSFEAEIHALGMYVIGSIC